MVGDNENPDVEVNHDENGKDELEKGGTDGEVRRPPKRAPTGPFLGVFLAARISHLRDGQGRIIISVKGPCHFASEFLVQVQIAEHAGKRGGDREEPEERNADGHQPLGPPLVPIHAHYAKVAFSSHLWFQSITYK